MVIKTEYFSARKNSQNLVASWLLLVGMISVLLLPFELWARIGVGVATGKIQLNENLKPGIVYDLPPLTVLNTGDEPSFYEVTIQYYEVQDQLKPAEGWFTFSPQSFRLEPGAGQAVDITITVPVKAEPGDYFAFLEGRPKKVESANTQVSVAAAAKLYFTVEPANFFQGLYYRLASFISRTTPWSYVVLSVIVLAIIFIVIKRNFTLQIGIGRKK